jgi:uncharacterized protein (TIGR02145 family)
MNKFLLLIIICLIAFNSCKKENNPLAPVSPSIPTLVLPTNNSVNVITSPILIWNSSNTATSYNLKVAIDNGFTNIIATQSKITDTSYQINALISSTSYYWKVSATNSNGTSDWSSAWKFTTGLAPSAPTLSSPRNNSLTVFMPVTFSWNAVTGATSYTLQVSTDISFNTFGYNQASITTNNQQVTVLKPLTQYYWKVSTTNEFGTSNWSTPAWNFITASGGNTGTTCPGIPTISYSNRTYNTVQIGNQCWLKENLDVGTMIPGIQTQTNNNIIEKFCYNDDSTKCKIYGGLYQWDEAMQYGASGTNIKGICPPGWHLPDTNDFNTLSTTLNNNGNALKAVFQGSGSGAGTDASGFSALLSGYRGSTPGFFSDLGYHTFFWSSIESATTNAQIMWLGYVDIIIYQNPNVKNVGFSVRCIKD